MGLYNCTYYCPATLCILCVVVPIPIISCILAFKFETKFVPERNSDIQLKRSVHRRLRAVMFVFGEAGRCRSRQFVMV